ncbi:MAG: DUF4034 domain-containing protein [Nitrospirae bacterium]|nr:DUF4034 domain-containing protein [Nitrospirota bacterium]
MTTRHIFISLLIVFCSLSVPATSFAVPQYVVDVDMDFAVSRDIREYFDKEDFTALEEIAKDLRDNDRRFLNGSPLLAAYYEAFSMAPDTNADYEKDEGYKRSLDLLAKWKLAYPDSVTQRVAEACVWLDYAWLARGSGYADTVDEKGWVLFDKRVQKAYDLLKDAPADGAEDCPQRYASLLTVGMAQGWGKRRYDTVFDEAVSY